MFSNVHSVRAPEESARAFVYRVLSLYIRELFLSPGERLAETEVAQTLRVSRTPVHDTFSRLERERMLCSMPHGTVVTALDADAVRQAVWMRRSSCTALLGELYNSRTGSTGALEACVEAEYRALNSGTLIAMAKLHRDFFCALYALGGRTVVFQAMSRMDADAYRLLRLLENESLWGYILDCHADMVRALKAHRYEAAVAALTREFDLFDPILEEYSHLFPTYFARENAV